MSKLKAKPPEIIPAGKTKMLVFGGSGVGKTWFSLTFPKPYFIDCEGGARLSHYRQRLADVGGAYLGVEDGALDFSVVAGQMAALATEKHEYRTLVIDSITKLYQTAIATEQERLGEKDAFGASKKPAVAGMRRLVNWATRLDMNIIFIAHEGTEWGVNPRSGQREEIGKMADVWDKLSYELDLTIRTMRRGGEYPATASVTKSRLTQFALGEQFSLDYATFAAKYGRVELEGVARTITLASAEQVAEITRMVELLKIPSDETDKIMVKAGAESWNELAEEHAVKTIKWLTLKIKGEK